MSAQTETTRWWENYLVRYLMPSIAGLAIVSWLCSVAGDEFRASLSLPAARDRIDGTSLILLFLYGNLFCYIASYPVLVFHVTRVMDFSTDDEQRWLWRENYAVLDGYICASVFTAITFLIYAVTPGCRFFGAYAMVVLLGLVQLARLRRVMSPRLNVDGVDGQVSPAFGLSHSLALRRGPGDKGKAHGERTTKLGVAWRREFMDTYRHMREHGNTAFIFVFELALAALVYYVIKGPLDDPAQQLSAIGVLFGMWAAPAVFVHLLGQHLERRFSHYNRNL